MKKDWIFTPILSVIGILLFLLKQTGLNVHIAISLLGLVVLIAYAITTKKEWKIPALEVMMRAFYGIALITGVVVMNVAGVAAVVIIHKVSAILFCLLLIGLFVHKLVTAKKA